MDLQNNISSILKKNSLIPVVSFDANDDPIPFVDYLIKQNINCIEVTLRNSFAFEAIEIIKRYNPNNFDIGVGTVVNLQQLDKLKEIGVDFIVSPAYEQGLIQNFQKSNIPFLPGVSTPSEILHALSQNINYLKFFPANLFGGINALKTYASVFSGITFCPTGGIGENDYTNYLKLSNVVSVGGSWIHNNFKKQL